VLRMLHLADLHLGYEPAFLDDEKSKMRQRERDALLKRAVDYAIDPANAIDMVVIVGDLFETHKPEGALVQEVIRQIGRLQMAGLFVVTVPGNHDEISYHTSVYREKRNAWPGVLVGNPMPELVASTEVRGIPIRFYSMAYTAGLTNVQALGSVPRSAESGLHIAAFHGSLDWDAGDRSLPLRSQDLAKAGYSYIALGHIHRYAEMRAGRTPAIYPGAVEGKSLSDPGVGHFTIVEFEKDKVNLKKHPVAVRQYRSEELDISVVGGEEDLLELCRKKRDPEALVEMVLTGTPSFFVDTLRLESVLCKEFFYLKFKDNTSVMTPQMVARYAGEHTVRGEFVRRLAARMDSAQDERERRMLKMALLRGLAAFSGGESR